MAKYKQNEIDKAIAAAGNNIAAILLYGPNETLVSDLALRAVRKIAGNVRDPFNVVNISESMLRDNPTLITDEVQALSFTSGRKVVWIKQAGNSLTKKIDDALKLSPGGNVIVLQAGQLTKSSSLRVLFEKAHNAACIGCYEDTPATLKSISTKMLSDSGMSIERSALEELVGLSGTNRLILQSELDKLISYKSGKGEINRSDVLKVCSDPSQFDLDFLCDAALLGNRKTIMEQYFRLTLSGTPIQRILSTLTRHVETLQKICDSINRGMPTRSAINSVRPQIFFKRIESITKQAGIWSPETLSLAATTILEATALSRKNPGIEKEICERVLISLSATSKRSPDRRF